MPSIATDKVLRNTGAELAVIFYVDGVERDADGNVLVTVTKPDGTLIANGVVADDATGGDGKYEWELTPQADLTSLTLDWTGDFSGVTMTVRTFAEIIGQHLFTINDLRSFRAGKLSDTNKYPTEQLIDVREEVTAAFRKVCNVSFTELFRRITLDGNGESTTYLPNVKVNTVQTITEDGTALDVANDVYLYDDGRMVRADGTWQLGHRNLVVEYEHGWTSPPGDVARAGLVFAHSLILGTDLMDRSITHVDDTGVYRLAQPDTMRERPTGIPYVDAVLNRYVEYWGVM